MKTMLKVEHLFKYFTGLVVLSDVNVDILEGERHVIIGPNGAGKTTLFNIISGLYKANKGKVLYLDKDISGWPAHKIARSGISRSFQIINIFPAMTVYENVRSAIVSRFNRGFNWTSFLDRHKEIARDTEDIIDLLSLRDVRDVLAAELSYGRQRHLELALTVARRPLLIMLDEPTAGFNSEESKNAVHLIRQITEGKTLVMVEHDMDVVFNLADRITVLTNGTVLMTGTPDEVRKNDKVKRAYLGRK
jgi:branched-chain amino acid transport system ATP-binding protein